MIAARERLEAALVKIPLDDDALRLTWPRDYGEPKAPDCIVSGLLERGTLAAIFGPSNTGKSTFAIDLALAVARGTPWRDHRTKAGLVLYVGLESVQGLRRRVQAYQRQHDLPPIRNFADIGESVSLLDSDTSVRIIAAARQAGRLSGTPCVLIVIDTLARALAGADENDFQDMGKAIAACDRIRHETGATVLLVHHSGKDAAKGARGHSSLRAALDTEIEVSGDANPRQARVTKQRDLPSGDTFAFDLEPVEIGTDHETNEAITAAVVVHRDDIVKVRSQPRGRAQTDLLRALRNRQAEATTRLIWTIADLRKIGRDLGQHRNTAITAVDGLRVAGFLISSLGGMALAEDSQ